MKNKILTFLLASFLTSLSYTQTVEELTKKKAELTQEIAKEEELKKLVQEVKELEKKKNDILTPKKEEKVNIDSDNFGWNRRISFFAGGGFSVISNTVYELPTIDRGTNIVKIDEADRIKPNISFGIVFTPKVVSVTRSIPVEIIKDETNTKCKIDSTSTEKTKPCEKKYEYVIEYYPKGWSGALFINPLSFSSPNSNLSQTVDLGLGFGYRSGGFSLFATAEFFSLKQPRDSFIEQFKNNDKQLIIATEVQTAIDVNDNSIFTDKVMVAFGIKLAYTFDIVKSYSKVISSQ